MKAQSCHTLIDTHAHLASSKFAGEIGEIVERAASSGVGRIVTIACDLEDSRTNLELAERFPGVAPTAGIHPLYVHEIESEDWDRELRAVAKRHDLAALGEIGLDYFHPPQDGTDEESWRHRQREVFERQLDLARELELPVVVHQRDSTADVTEVLRQFPEVKAVLHCFNGTREAADRFLEMGHLLSFTGILTFPRAEDVREVARAIPIDRIMVETDCPYLAPVPFRGKRCEPSMVRHTAECLAEIRNMTLDEIAEVTTRNAVGFFNGLPEQAS
jgi:TatD DNase family protein